MAFGKHWEWRGFGAVGESFRDRFAGLEPAFGPQEVADHYLWVPGLQTNIKIREGEAGGLKFKRFVAEDGRFQCWSEDPDELYELPLQKKAWQSLAAALAATGISLGLYPDRPPDGERLLALLGEAGCSILLVRKEREGRWWPGPNGRVLVELAGIRAPVAMRTAGLESENLRVGGAGLSDGQAKEDLRAAISALRLENEPLSVMSYMEALALWVRDR